MNDRLIFLTGYMASGKTTFGRALAARLAIPFIDLDEAVAAGAGMSVPEIFRREGEEGFRRRESEMLRRLCAAARPAVVACGGGTPCRPGNMEMMSEAGLTVWLRAGIPCIVRRILEAGDTRPVVSGIPADGLPAFVESHLAGRLPYYRRAHLHIDGEHLEDALEIEETVEKFIRTIECL